MQVVELPQYGETPRLGEQPDPQPGPGQVVVRVQAAAINPIDRVIATGALAGWAAHIAPPIVLGFDVAGVVEAVGEGAPFEVGQEVAGLTNWFERGVGSFAELVVVAASSVVAVPAGVGTAVAASVPLAGLTARQSLDLLDVHAGQRVLVTGASGAVGGFAVPLASAAGARVVALVSAGDEDRVLRLGAEHVVTRGGDVVAAVRQLVPEGVDAALDAGVVGAGLIGAVRDGGMFVAVMDPAVPEAERGVHVVKVSAAPSPEQLGQLLGEVAAGRLPAPVAHEVPFAEAEKAFALSAQHGLRGKVVLVP